MFTYILSPSHTTYGLNLKVFYTGFCFIHGSFDFSRPTIYGELDASLHPLGKTLLMLLLLFPPSCVACAKNQYIFLRFCKGNRAFAELRYGEEDSISPITKFVAATKG